MALKATVSTLDDIEEAHRPLYVERDGKYVLDVDADPGGALKSALQKERTTNSTLKKRLKDLGLDDRDDAEIAELLDLGEKAKQGVHRATDQVEQVKTALTKSHQKEVDKKDATIRELTGSLEDLLVEGAAKDAIRDQKGDDFILLPHIRSQVVVVRNDEGKYVARVKGEKPGEFRLNDSGDPMSPADLVAEMRANPKYESAFRGAGGSGGGARGDAIVDDLPERGSRASRNRGQPTRTARVNDLVERKRRNGAMAI